MKTNKKRIGAAVFVAVLIVAIAIFAFLSVCWNQSADFHLYLGEKYLDALDYEQALAEFQRAIDIDPKKEESYGLMADVYDAMGEEAKAAEVLRNGYLKTSSRDLVERAEDDYDIDIKLPIQSTDDQIIVKEVGLDICFVIDTTGSMSGAIENAKENMENIIAQVAEKSEDYRIAIVDYRDYAFRSSFWEDYPAKLQLDFTSDREAIHEAINGLTLGNGGDDRETVYAGLMLAASLDWRKTSQHVVILIGDAGPLSPEPISGYTYEDVERAMKLGNADVNLDQYIFDSYDSYREGYEKYKEESSTTGKNPLYPEDDAYTVVTTAAVMDVDTVVVRTAGWGLDDKKTDETSERAEESEDTTAEAESGEEAGDSTGTVVNAADFSINVYGIVTSSWSSAGDSFGEICNNTGGSVSTVGDDSSLSEEICGIIEQVEIVPVSKDVAVHFGGEYADTTIEVYQGTQLIAEATLNDAGKGQIKDMLFGTYYWKDLENGAFGYLTVSAENDKADIVIEKDAYPTRIVMLEILIGALISAVLIITVSVIVVSKRTKKVKKELISK